MEVMFFFTFDTSLLVAHPFSIARFVGVGARRVRSLFQAAKKKVAM